MYGQQYASTPEILLDSFAGINPQYATQVKINLKLIPLIKIYLRFFGIPDVSFQLRAAYFEKTLRALSNFHPNRILDAGSGIGFYTLLLRRLYPGSHITGVDIDTRKLSFCRQLNLPGTNFKKTDLTTLSTLTNHYDLIVNVDVLEHISDYKQVLKNFHRLLCPGGVLYIHTPQINQQRTFKQLFNSWHHTDHVREGFPPRTLVRDLKKLGFHQVNYHPGLGRLAGLCWELNQLALARSLLLAALTFPLLHLASLLDEWLFAGQGLTAYYSARK